MPRTRRPFHNLVVNPPLIQRLLHAPALADLPLRGAPVKLDCRGATILPGGSVATVAESAWKNAGATRRKGSDVGPPRSALIKPKPLRPVATSRRQRHSHRGRHSGTQVRGHLGSRAANASSIRQSSASGTRGAVEFAVSTGRNSRSGSRPPERAADGPITEFLVDPEHRSVRLVVLCEHEFDATFGSVH